VSRQRVQEFGFRFSGFNGFKVWGLGFVIWDLGFGIWELDFNFGI